MTEITGHTRLYGILADPVAQVKTPQVMAEVFTRHGVDGVLVPMQVAPDGLRQVVDGLRRMKNFGGFIATMPHKPAMLGLCDVIEGDGARIGALNCVRREDDGRMVGAMLDGIGFVTGLRQAGIDPSGRRILLAGAGGAASAIAFALAEAGAEALTILNRTAAKAEDLAARVAAAYPSCATSGTGTAGDVGGCDLIANATSAGLRAGDPLPLPVEALHAGQVVAEAIMEPAETRLLAEARARGATVHPGLPMLRCQIELMARHMGAIA
ncbi:MAG: shikimate dehydrogenase family protein [Salipiger thiooxidans]|uniref:shikimate dehydrogenase family protein n=1 Tax=Salipiger thiooxidans TaxID=282683 RepID=UPI001CFABDAF|nr:shikimate dehydrogenase [Salipiger thiooxidans]